MFAEKNSDDRTMMISDKNVQVSDTTEGDSSNADGSKKSMHKTNT